MGHILSVAKEKLYDCVILARFFLILGSKASNESFLSWNNMYFPYANKWNYVTFLFVVHVLNMEETRCKDVQLRKYSIVQVKIHFSLRALKYCFLFERSLKVSF
ncbi:hypothetical protein Dimus_020397 [Dionaea muscipula]